jgi:hypothetical protein
VKVRSPIPKQGLQKTLFYGGKENEHFKKNIGNFININYRAQRNCRTDSGFGEIKTQF